MNKALFGIYYKTLKDASNAFLKMSDWMQKNHSIVEFDNCCLIVGNEQIKKLEVDKRI